MAVLVLIQLGGLGIMTFSTVALRLLGRRISLRYEGAVADLIGAQDRSLLFLATKHLLLFTLVVEAAEVVCLTPAFLFHGDGNIAAVHSGTLALMMLWMFIGGSPGGTAGGIKTTTAAVLVLAFLAMVRGRETAIAFHRRISHSTVYRAGAIATVAAAAVFLALLVLQLTQAMPTRMALFEVVSALGTVGLSLGGTSHLDGVGGRASSAVCLSTALVRWRWPCS